MVGNPWVSQPLHWTNQKCQVRSEEPTLPRAEQGYEKGKGKGIFLALKELNNESAQERDGISMPKAEGPLTTPLSKTNGARLVPLGFQLVSKKLSDGNPQGYSLLSTFLIQTP